MRAFQRSRHPAGLSPRWLAVGAGRAIGNQFDPNNKTTPLIQAIFVSHIEIVRVLLSHPEINVNLQDEKGDNYYNIIIDQKEPILMRASSDASYTLLADNLSKGKHSIKLFKRTEWTMGKTSFGGLFRVNSKGFFNVPFGHRKKPKFPKESLLLEVHKLIKNVHFSHPAYAKAICLAYNGGQDGASMAPRNNFQSH